MSRQHQNEVQGSLEGSKALDEGANPSPSTHIGKLAFDTGLFYMTPIVGNEETIVRKCMRLNSLGLTHPAFRRDVIKNMMAEIATNSAKEA